MCSVKELSVTLLSSKFTMTLKFSNLDQSSSLLKF